MARYGMLINTKKCVGCYACRLACQAKNHLEPGESFIKFHELETGTYPNVYNEIVPTQCQHCEDAPCAAVCPTHATYVTDSGVVLVDEEKCIGCKMCIAACPYGARSFNPITKVVEKCTLCRHLQEVGDVPACVKACCSEARFFGDIDDLESDVAKAIAAAGPENVHSMPDMGNKPTVRYILHKKNGTWNTTPPKMS